jgi:hypothetical protein
MSKAFLSVARFCEANSADRKPRSNRAVAAGCEKDKSGPAIFRLCAAAPWFSPQPRPGTGNHDFDYMDIPAQVINFLFNFVWAAKIAVPRGR